MDTLHTNEERIEKIRCLFNTIETISDDWPQGQQDSIIGMDLVASRECLDAIEAFINQRNTLDCI